MYIINYYRKDGVWHLEASSFNSPGNKPVKTERTGNIARLLDLAAQGKDTVSIYLGFKPFPMSSEANLVRVVEGSGAFYHIGTFSGKLVNLEFFVDNIPFLGGAPMPETLYLRVIAPPAS